MKAFLNCPNCSTAGWTETTETDAEQVAPCPICKELYPLNHKAVEILVKD